MKYRSLLKEGIRNLLILFPFVSVVRVRINPPVYARFFVYVGKRRIYPLYSISWSKNNDNVRVIYLKVNRNADYTMLCVQQWIDVANALGAKVVFICDNKLLEKDLLSRIHFYDESFGFIRSARKELKEIIDNTTTSRWHNAGYAQLTAFYHAKKNKIRDFWTIDADDTMFCLSIERIKEMMYKVESITKENDYTVISLDMWHSRTKGNHWSWGVAYIRENVDFFDIFRSVKNQDWIISNGIIYKTGEGETNLDWFFTYLKNDRGLRIETFYLENAYFVHWGNFLKHPSMIAAVYHWHNNKLVYPIYKMVLKDSVAGEINISDDDIKIDIGISEKEGITFLQRDFGRI